MFKVFRLLLLPGLLLGLTLSSTTVAGTLLVVGDSISAAYGIDKEQGWVSLLAERLDAQCPGWQVKNASVSGETSSGGLARLPALLERDPPDLVIIELGGNDGLRGQPPNRMRDNLVRMIELSHEAGAGVLLFGMKIPPNYGEAYNRLFEQAFVDAAEQTGVPLLPFFLDGVAAEEGMMLDDGIHPSAEGQPVLLENAWGELWPKLEASCGSR